MSNDWTTSVSGVRKRPHTQALVIDFDFQPKPASRPNVLAIQPWKICDRVLSILGNHSVELDSYASSAKLNKSRVSWKRRSDCAVLRTSLQELSLESTWRGIEAAASDTWYIRVTRGSGAGRHPAWLMNFDWHDRELSLAIATAHIPHDRSVQRLVNAAFEAAAQSPLLQCGRASVLEAECDPCNIVQADQYQPAFGPASYYSRAHWRQRSAAKPWIPYIAHANLLNKTQFAALGGHKFFKQLNAELRRDPRSSHTDIRISELPNHFIHLQLINIDAFWLTASWRSVEQSYLSDYKLLLTRLAANLGLLHFQDPQITSDLLAERRSFREVPKALVASSFAAAQKSPFTSLSPKQLKTVMSYYWSRPPRCIRTVGAISSPDTDPKFVTELHEATTCFNVLPLALGKSDKNKLSALPIYGLRTPDEPLLASPIRIGSTNSDRAIFSFDSHVDGYDAEIAAMDRKLPREAKPRRLKQLVCPDCQGRLFHARAAFEYPLDEELKDDPACWSHRQDFFTWFWLEAQCATCPWRALVADIECA